MSAFAYLEGFPTTSPLGVIVDAILDSHVRAPLSDEHQGRIAPQKVISSGNESGAELSTLSGDCQHRCWGGRRTGVMYVLDSLPQWRKTRERTGATQDATAMDPGAAMCFRVVMFICSTSEKSNVF